MSGHPRILMVCLGNICRSPIAEGLLKHRAEEKGISVIVDSAGTSGYHAGELPDTRMMQTAHQFGIDISYQRSRQLRLSDFEEFDRIFAMDRSNFRNILKLTNTLAYHQKVEMILDLVSPGANMEVPDPYFGGEQGFVEVFQMLDKAVLKLLDELR